jgi:hypothetical protein
LKWHDFSRADDSFVSGHDFSRADDANELTGLQPLKLCNNGTALAGPINTNKARQ